MPRSNRDVVPAFDILNKRKLAGIFQFQASTSRQTILQINKIDDIEDIVSLTALNRPGPLGSGGTERWIRRKNGPDAPLRLSIAAKLAFPDGSLTASGRGARHQSRSASARPVNTVTLSPSVSRVRNRRAAQAADACSARHWVQR